MGSKEEEPHCYQPEGGARLRGTHVPGPGRGSQAVPGGGGAGGGHVCGLERLGHTSDSSALRG